MNVDIAMRKHPPKLQKLNTPKIRRDLKISGSLLFPSSTTDDNADTNIIKLVVDEGHGKMSAAKRFPARDSFRYSGLDLTLNPST